MHRLIKKKRTALRTKSSVKLLKSMMGVETLNELTGEQRLSLIG